MPSALWLVLLHWFIAYGVTLIEKEQRGAAAGIPIVGSVHGVCRMQAG